jgi:hypothetical protein
MLSDREETAHENFQTQLCDSKHPTLLPLSGVYPVVALTVPQLASYPTFGLGKVAQDSI